MNLLILSASNVICNNEFNHVYCTEYIVHNAAYYFIVGFFYFNTCLNIKGVIILQ